MFLEMTPNNFTNPALNPSDQQCMRLTSKIAKYPFKALTRLTIQFGPQLHVAGSNQKNMNGINTHQTPLLHQCWFTVSPPAVFVFRLWVNKPAANASYAFIPQWRTYTQTQAFIFRQGLPRKPSYTETHTCSHTSHFLKHIITVQEHVQTSKRMLAL